MPEAVSLHFAGGLRLEASGGLQRLLAGSLSGKSIGPRQRQRAEVHAGAAHELLVEPP